MTSILQSVMRIISSPWSIWNNVNAVTAQDNEESEEKEVFYSCRHHPPLFHDEDKDELFQDCINEYNDDDDDDDDDCTTSNSFNNSENKIVNASILKTKNDVSILSLPPSLSARAISTSQIPSPPPTSLPSRSSSVPTTSSSLPRSHSNLFTGVISNSSLHKHYISTGRCPTCTQFCFRRDYSTNALLPLTDFCRTFNGRCLKCKPLKNVDLLELYYEGTIPFMISHIGRCSTKTNEKLLIHDNDEEDDKESNLSVMYRYVRHTALLPILNDVSKHELPDVLIPTLLSSMGRQSQRIQEEEEKKRRKSMKIMWSFLKNKQEILIHATGFVPAPPPSSSSGEGNYCTVCGKTTTTMTTSLSKEKKEDKWCCLECKAFQKDYKGLIQDLSENLQNETIQDQILSLLSSSSLSLIHKCQEGVVDAITQSIKMYSNNEILVEHGCTILATLYSSDDTKEKKHMKQQIEPKNDEMVNTIHTVLNLHPASSNMQEKTLEILTHLFQHFDNNNIETEETETKNNNNYHQTTTSIHNVNKILNTTVQIINTENYQSNIKIQQFGLRLISNILAYYYYYSTTSNQTATLSKEDLKNVITNTLNVMCDHNTDESIQEYAIHTLYSLCRYGTTTTTSNMEKIYSILIEKEAVKMVVNAMTTHVNATNLQTNSCRFLSCFLQLLLSKTTTTTTNTTNHEEDILHTIQEEEAVDAISMSLFLHSQEEEVVYSALSFLYRYIKISEKCAMNVVVNEDVGFCMIGQFVRDAKESFERCGEFADYILKVLEGC